MKKYETITYETVNGKTQEKIIRNDGDGLITHIPADPANSDYQRYLRWLENPDAEEGGTL